MTLPSQRTLVQYLLDFENHYFGVMNSRGNCVVVINYHLLYLWLNYNVIFIEI